MNANTRNTIKLIVGAIGFFALLVGIQVILEQHNRRLDLTPQKKFTLSPRTENVVSKLKRDVQLTAFINSDRPENFFIEDLLGRMAALSPHFRYSVIDINRNPAIARQYDATQYGTLIFEGNQQKRTLVSAGESAMVSALLQVTRVKGDKIIYFLTGHGEGDLTNASPEEGYGKLRGALADEFYSDKLLSLAQTGAVPEDAAVVVILGPKTEFSTSELSALDAYVQRGGELFVLLDPKAPSSLVTFLETYGVHAMPLVAVDPSQRLYAGEMISFRASATADPHPMITSVKARPIFSLARVVEVRPDSAKGITARPILATSGAGWATAQENINNEGTTEFVKERDVIGPVPIAGEVTLQKGETRGRIVVFGDADLANNFLIEHGGNKDLFVNAINWLAEDIEQIGTRTPIQKPGPNQLFLSEEQGRLAAFLTTVLMPGSLVIVGVGIFFWQKQREK
ncbi:MAG: GldG family protein [Candidatus Binatia bacterium]